MWSIKNSFAVTLDNGEIFQDSSMAICGNKEILLELVDGSLRSFIIEKEEDFAEECKDPLWVELLIVRSTISGFKTDFYYMTRLVEEEIEYILHLVDIYSSKDTDYIILKLDNYVDSELFFGINVMNIYKQLEKQGYALV